MPRPERPLDGPAGPVGELAAGLRQLREEAGKPGYRQMAARVNYSVATLSAAASGRRLPTLEVTLAYVAACDGDVQEWERRWRETERRSVALAEEPAVGNGHASSPYPGLTTFQAEDADVFFGRGALVGELVRRLGQRRFLAVFGPSGSGKSSVMRAGLVPAVGGPAVVLTPGVHPLAELAVHLARHAGVRAGGLLDEFRADPARAQLMVRQGLSGVPADVDLLVVVDQFEEVFASCTDAAERTDFVAALLAMCREPDGRARVVLAVRADHYTRFTAHSGPVSDLAFTADGRTLVTASKDRSIAVWDTHSHQRIASLTGHDTWLRAVAITPDGSTVASGGDDQGIVLWNPAGHVRIATLAGHTGAVKDVAFSSDGRLLASGGADDTVVLWDVARHTAIARLTGHGGTVNSVEFSPDGRVLAAAGTGHTIVLWDVATHTRLRTLAGHTDDVNKVAFDPKGRYLASAGDTTVRLWNVADGSPRNVLTGHTDRVKALAFSSDGTTVASAGYDTTVLLWDVGHGALRARLAGHTTSVYALAFGAGSTLASAGERGSVILWDTDRASLVETAGGGARDLAFSKDGGILVEAADNLTTVWDTRKRRRLQVFTGTSTVNAVALSPDGVLLATANEDSTVTLWDLTTGTQVTRLTGHDAAVLDVAFSPDGRNLVTGSVDRTAIVWDLATRTRRTTLTSHTAPINGVAFSPDGRTLATASHDFTTVLWNTADWSPRTRLTGHKGWVRAVTFSPDGHTLVTADGASAMLFWDTDAEREAHRICDTFGRELSDDEWKQFVPDLPHQNTC